MIYHRPMTLSDALQVLAKQDVKILAGGTDIFPSFAGAELSGGILDITNISELRRITQTENGWFFGAACTWSQIAEATLPGGFAALQQAAGMVGSCQFQNAGTLAGNLCNASPAADGVPPLLVMNAEVEIQGQGTIRRVALQKFLQGVRKVNLADNQMVTGIFAPESATAGVSVFEKLGARAYLVISISMVAVRLSVEGGIITDIAISVGASAPVAKRLYELEGEILKRNINEVGSINALISSHSKGALFPIDDIRSSAGYRLDASAELIQRGIFRALKAAI